MQGQLIEEIYELTYVTQALQELSGMDKVINDLYRLGKTLENQSFYMQKSAKFIGNVAESYILCEDKILSKYENSIVNYNHAEPSVVELNEIRNILGL